MPKQLKPPKPNTAPNTTYDVFLSYSRRDIEFVKLLEKALTEYQPADGQHRLSVFRDEGKITGNEYYRSIERALRQSRKLILVASPDAYKSQYVNDEVRDFIRMKGARNVFVILLKGVRKNEMQQGEEPLLAVPELLWEVMELPLDVNYRDFGNFRGFDNEPDSTKREKQLKAAQAELTKGRHLDNWRRVLEYIYGEELVPAEKESRDIFISYAAADAAFARQLRKELGEYAPPKELARDYNLPARRLKVFRDEEDGNPNDQAAIRHALECSQSMFLICSPAACNDERVHKQIARFAEMQNAERIVPVVVKGEAVPDAAESAFPSLLCRLIKEPPSTDYRGFKLGKGRVNKGAYSPHWATLLGHHYQVNRDEVEQREARRQAVVRRRTISILGIIISLLSLALVLTIQAQNQAELARQEAIRQRDRAELSEREALKQRDEALRAQNAEKQAKDAETRSALEAKQQRDLAIDARNEAETRRREAIEQRDLAILNERRSNHHRYAARQVLVQKAIDEEDHLTANNLLEEALVDLHDVRIGDLRSFDWLYYWGQIHNEIYTEKEISVMALAPDGKRVAAWSNQGEGGNFIVVIDPETGASDVLADGDAHKTKSFVFSPDSSRLASASESGEVVVWDLKGNNDKVTSLEDSETDIVAMAFSPNNRALALGGKDNVIRIWNLKSDAGMFELKIHNCPIISLAFSPNGKVLASSDGNSIKLWDTEAEKEILSLQEQKNWNGALAFSEDSKLLASGGADTIAVWEIASRKNLFLQKGLNADVLSFTTAGNLQAFVSTLYTIKVWDVFNKELKLTLSGASNSIDDLSVSKDGNVVASRSVDGVLKVWNRRGVTINRKSIQELSAGGRLITLTSDGGLLAGVDESGMIKIWNSMDGSQKLEISPDERASFESIAFTQDAKILIVGCSDGWIRLWDISTNKQVAAIKAHENSVNKLELSTDGRLLASSEIAGEKAVKVWDTSTWLEKCKFIPDGSISTLKFSSDGRLLAGSIGKKIKLWGVLSNREIVTLKGHEKYVINLSFTPDNKTLVSLSSGEPEGYYPSEEGIQYWKARVKALLIGWDITNDREKWRTEWKADYINQSAISPDGGTMAYGDGGNVKMLDVLSGQEKITFRSKEDSISSISFSKDGRVLAIARGDSSIQSYFAANSSMIDKQCSRCKREQ
jgi:WD40 repeat protein